jgi:hypothetical protein
VPLSIYFPIRADEFSKAWRIFAPIIL